MEGNIPLTIFNVLLTGVEILGIGEGVKSAIKLGSASVKAYKIAKYGEVIYENTKQNRVVRSFPKLSFKIKDTTVMNSEQAAELISNVERKGTALKKHDLYHEQAGHLTKEELEQGKMFILSSKNGEKILFQVKGKLGDKEGIYEYLLEKDGKVSHQMFVKKKEIDGHFGYDR